MKRIFGAILILIIVALFISVHAYQPLNNVLSSGIEVIRKVVVNSYDKFATFCYNAIGKLSSNHFGLSIENWALVGYIIVLVLFLIVYFILFGIIAHIRNKRIINKKKGATRIYPLAPFAYKLVCMRYPHLYKIFQLLL